MVNKKENLKKYRIIFFVKIKMKKIKLMKKIRKTLRKKNLKMKEVTL